jgi:hypothetical protein
VNRFSSIPARMRGRRVQDAQGGSRRPPPICQNIQRWCEEHPEGEHRVITPASRITRRSPRTLEARVDPSFEPLCDVEVPDRALVRVAGARLLGPNGLVSLPDGSFVGELVALTESGRRAMLEGQPAYRELMPRRVRRRRGHFYPLFAIGWENYYHWNHDVIMRASRVIDHLPPDTRFIVPPNLKPFQYETLRLLGIETSRVEVFDGRGAWELESLTFSTPILKTQIDTREPLAWFKTATMALYGILPLPRQRRLYLSRRLDGHYRTVNEPEVEACLHEHGFETVVPGTLSLRDQAALFAEADVIVGTGTGLSNMVFAPEGARVLQFQEPSLIVHALWTMAESLRHRYWYSMGVTVPNPDATLPNIFVPLAKLEDALIAMLSDTG